MPTIDLAFELVGNTIPLDHGYSLFAALTRVVESLHGDRRIGVHPIRGQLAAPRTLRLVPGSRLRLRLPSEEVAAYLAFAGKQLDLDGHRLRVGIPRVESLVPAANLASRLVTFRNALDPERFLADVEQGLKAMNIEGKPSLVPTTDPKRAGQAVRRVLRIKGKQIVGFALRIGGLAAEESIRLQEEGLGGRRRMGCGVFVPVEENSGR